MRSRRLQMGQGGVAEFLACKVGVALAALTLLWVALGMASSLKRANEAGELDVLAETIAETIREVGRLPSGTELRMGLPPATDVRVEISGERIGDAQTIRVVVESGERAERVITIASRVNGGEFSVAKENPSAIHLRKDGDVLLELT